MEPATPRHNSSKHTARNTPKHTGKNAKSTANGTNRDAANTKPRANVKNASKDTGDTNPGDGSSNVDAAGNHKETQDFGSKPLGRSTDAQRARALNFPRARRPGPTRRGDRAGRRGVRR